MFYFSIFLIIIREDVFNLRLLSKKFGTITLSAEKIGVF